MGVVENCMVLSVANPWAWAIFYCGKDVENRSWFTSYLGTIFIHASKTRRVQYEEDCLTDILLMTPESMRTDEWRRTSDINVYPRGVIIGAVDLLCITTKSKSPWAVPGEYHWVLQNPRRLQVPIEHRGRLGLRPFVIDKEKLQWAS